MNTPILEKSEARLATVKALYACITGHSTPDAKQIITDILTYYRDQEEGLGPIAIDEKFLTKLINGIMPHQDALDIVITKHLDAEWKLERIDPVLRAILQAGAYELSALETIPTKVIINEYIEIAKQFFDTKEVGFVNASLDRIANDVRAQA